MALKKALITGAAGGIGAATVVAALGRGYQVFAVDSNEERLQQRWGDQDSVRAYAIDIRSASEVSDVIRDMGSDAALVVNCAGVGNRALIADLTDQDWAEVLSVNLTGTMVVCREVLRQMPRNSVIVNITSIAAHRSFAGRAAYCSTKAAVVAFTEVLSLECAGKGIRAFAVSPGYVDTLMAQEQEGFVSEAMILSRVPFKRLAQPSEIANSILALASEDFTFLSGSTVVIDGGWNANGGFWPVPALEEWHTHHE